MFKTIQRGTLLIALLILLGLFFYFRLYRYLSFESLKENRAFLLAWSEQHFVWVVLGFIGIYTISVACSIPGAILLTLTAGVLFGIWWGTLWVVISATLGAFIVFLAVELALRDWVAKKTAKWLKGMEQGFQANAFSYLLILRLVPLFPFWLVNIVPALLGVSKRTFMIATFIGIIPGSFVYVLVGNGLGSIFDTNETPNLGIIFDPKVLLPLIALAMLSLAPVVYKMIQRRRQKNHDHPVSRRK
jgi:uncharacterized membrane protein YdjX (TVP38/TMEM64 family)